MSPRVLSPKEKKKLIVAVAIQHSRGTPQKRIASTLDLSQPTVSRFIRIAQDEGWLAKSPLLFADKIGPEFVARVEEEFFYDPDLTPRLLERFGQDGVRLDIRTYRDTVFEKAGADYVATLLSRSMLVGVMWGRTIYELVRNLDEGRARVGPSRVSAFRCVPLCGDPLFLMNQSQQVYSASALAARLERICTGQVRPDLPSLSGVPAYLGRRVRADYELDAPPGDPLRRFVESIPGFETIFGRADRDRQTDSAPLLHRLDMILTGVGSLADGTSTDHAPVGTFILERIAQEPDVDVSALREVAWGDLGGLLLGRKETGEESPLVADLNAGWMGIKLRDFRSMVERATRHRLPGVVLLASGASKAPIVLEAVRRGLVNTVLCDRALGAELGCLLDSEVAPP